jgi:hypothetical protein
MDYGPGGCSRRSPGSKGPGTPVTEAGRDASAAGAPVILERSGQEVGLLAYCDASCGAATYARPGSPGVAALDLNDCCTAIRALQSEVDWVTLQVHWGQ